MEKAIGLDLVENYVQYAISCRVHDLHVDFCHIFPLSIFNPTWLKELKLTMRPGSAGVSRSDCWNFPVLTKSTFDMR